MNYIKCKDIYELKINYNIIYSMFNKSWDRNVWVFFIEFGFNIFVYVDLV